MESQIIVPAPAGSDAYLELARTKSGRLFRKHILTKGELLHPVTKERVQIDDAFVGALKRNFEDGVCDIVQVPLANDQNQHVEAPERNIGEVVGLEEDGDKVYAIIDARKPDAAEQLGKTLLGASAFMHTNYVDTRTGEAKGPTLLHVAVTNRPYVVQLDPYEELIAASSDGSAECAVLLTQQANVLEENPVDLAQITQLLKEEYGIDLVALQVAAAQPPAAPSFDVAALSAALAATGAMKLSAQSGQDPDSLTSDDVITAVAELAQDKIALSAQVEEQGKALAALTRDKVVGEVDGLVKAGRVLPAQKDAMVELALSNRAMFDKIVPAQPFISLSAETGTGAGDDATAQAEVEAQAHIDKYVALANAQSGRK
jgi:hypothetical protein